MALRYDRTTRLLFIGDSITDCGRRTDDDRLGHGYVRLIHEWLLARDPAACPAFVNMGISGNKITDLKKRWQRDVLDERADILSIKIGINDVWHGLVPEREGVAIERFVEVYRELLMQLRSALPDCRLVLCEPSVIDPPQDARANDVLQPYVRAVHELAEQFKAVGVVRLHEAFVRARAARPDVAWTTDGVHPNPVGHTLIARTWLETVGWL